MRETVLNREEMVVKKEYPLRYTTPTKYDKAPYGTICKVVGDSEKYDLYIQVYGDNVEECHWIKLGDYLETAFKEGILNQEFIDDLLVICEKR
jgi:hypothetical protein